jgi:ABC-type glycerol-3-phosphate transport system substrate-binding protein
LPPELSSENPAVLSSYTVGNTVVAIPNHAYVGVLYYQSRLTFFEDTDNHQPPATWDELETMSAADPSG